MPDSALIARRIGVSSPVLVCSPEYARKHGVPASLDELASRRCLCYSNAPPSQTWSFRASATRGKPSTLSPPSAFASNNGEALRDAALRGVGPAIVPSFIVGKDLMEGRLIRLLPDEQPEDDVIYAVQPYCARKARPYRQAACESRIFECQLLPFVAERMLAYPASK
ncbi:substrate binding domain-containing protein [Paraburkholderia sp. BR10937]|uniref:substrate binding domain-containing protein n=1 Tax=Paraburkholderia sp. BR10937 TaxID=3236994 RepID=UPI0034D306B8